MDMREYNEYKKRFSTIVLDHFGDRPFGVVEFKKEFLRLEEEHKVDVCTPFRDGQGGWSFTSFDRIKRFMDQKTKEGLYTKEKIKGKYIYTRVPQKVFVEEELVELESFVKSIKRLIRKFAKGIRSSF